MITVPTVFVIGAGASVDYGFPTGDQLLRGIAGEKELLPLWTEKGSPSNPGSYELFVSEAKRLRDFQRHVRQSGLFPVDRVVERQSKNPDPVSAGRVQLWKLTIAQEILACEARHRDLWLHANDAESQHSGYLDNKPKPCEPWFRHLFSRLEDGTTRPEEIISRNRFHLWTFNYDRLLEKLFYDAFRANYDLPASDALELVRRLPIRHVHGDVGQFAPSAEVSSANATQGAVEFGSTKPADVELAASRVIPAHEELPLELPQKLWEAVVNGLEGPRPQIRLAFLGFGFDRRNIEKLRIHKKTRSDAVGEIYATWRGTGSALPPRLTSLLDSMGRDPADIRFFPSISELLAAIPN